MQHSNIFGTSRVKESKLKMKASDKEIDFKEFGRVCEGAPLARGANKMVVEKTTLLNTDFSECTTVTELCQSALLELVKSGAEVELAKTAMADFLIVWGRMYYGLTPFVNYVNLKLELVREDIKNLRARRESKGSAIAYSIRCIELDFAEVLSDFIFSGRLEEDTYKINDLFVGKLIDKLAERNDRDLIYIINDRMNHG